MAAEVIDGCTTAGWATLEPKESLVFWQVQPASPELIAAARQAVITTPSHTAKQKHYEQYEDATAEVTAAVERQRASSVEARHEFAWYEGGSRSGPWRVTEQKRASAWVVSGPVQERLLVTYFDSSSYVVVPESPLKSIAPSPNIRRESLGSGRASLSFDGRVVVIAKVDSAGQRVVQWVGDVSSDPAQNQSLGDFELFGAVARDHGLPALLFKAAWVYGAMRPVSERYVIDHNLMVAPPKISALD